MAKKNELPALIIALLITVAILGGGAVWLTNYIRGGSENPSAVDSPTRPDSPNGEGGRVGGADGTSGRSMLPGNVSSAKQAGLDALAAGDYTEARRQFEAALQENRNDPESAIYLNNSIVGEDRAYTIAVVVPAESNVNPSLEIMRGVAQAQRDINENGGINGTPLKVVLFDDAGDERRAEEIASSLVEDEAVLGVVGHYSSGVTLAAAAIYEAGKLPVISPTSTAVKIANAGDYVFRTVPSDRLAAKALANYVLNQLNKKEAVVFYEEESTYSKSVKDEFTQEFLSGGNVASSFDVGERGFNASEALQSAKEAGADVIVLALTADTRRASLDILAANQRALPVVGGDDLYDFDILKDGQQNAEGLTVAVPWHILSHTNSPFVQESERLWGAAINWRTVTAYDAVRSLAAAIEAGGATREDIQAELSNSSFRTEGATDEIRFFPSGDRTQPSALVKVEKTTNGPSGTGYDYIPVQ